jgi:hypothetical protein
LVKTEELHSGYGGKKKSKEIKLIIIILYLIIFDLIQDGEGYICRHFFFLKCGKLNKNYYYLLFLICKALKRNQMNL